VDLTYATWTLTLLEPLSDDEVKYLSAAFRAAKMMAYEAKSGGPSVEFDFSEWNHPNVLERETFESRFLPAYGPISSGKVLVELIHGSGENFHPRYGIRRGDKAFVAPLSERSELVLQVPLLMSSVQDSACAAAVRGLSTYRELIAEKSKAIEWPDSIHDVIANDPWLGLFAIEGVTGHSDSMLLDYLAAAINRAKLRYREYEVEPLTWLRDAIVDAMRFQSGALDRIRVAFNDLRLEAPYLAGAIRPALDELIARLDLESGRKEAT